MGFFDAASQVSGVNQFPALDSQQQTLYNTLMGQTLSQLQNPELYSYKGSYYTPTTPQEESYLGKSSILGQAMDNAYSALNKAYTVPYEVGPEWAENYWQKTLAPLYTQERDKLKESFGGSSFWSSALGEGLGKFDVGTTGKHAELLYAEELAKRQAMENAMGRVAQTAPSVLNNARLGMSDISSMSRDIANERISGDLTKYLSGGTVGGVSNPVYNPALSLAQSLLGLQTSVNQPYTTGTGAGLGYGALQGLAGSLGQTAAGYTKDALKALYDWAVSSGSDTGGDVADQDYDWWVGTE